MLTTSMPTLFLSIDLAHVPYAERLSLLGFPWLLRTPHGRAWPDETANGRYLPDTGLAVFLRTHSAICLRHPQPDGKLQKAKSVFPGDLLVL